MCSYICPVPPGEHVEMSKQEGQTFAQKSLILLSHLHEHLQGICIHFCDFQSIEELFRSPPPNTQEAQSPIMQDTSKIFNLSWKVQAPITAVCTTSYVKMVYCLGGFENTESWKRCE